MRLDKRHQVAEKSYIPDWENPLEPPPFIFLFLTSQFPGPRYTCKHCNVLGRHIHPHHNVGTWTGGMAYVSLFLILFRILMTRHLQLPAGQIQCFLIYILFPCEFHYFEYGACKLSKFLILYKILMTQHLRLPTGQIQCLPTYSLSPCELHYISNTQSDLTVVWQPLQVQLIFRSDAMASATEIQTYNSCNTCRFWRCTMHFVCTDHLMCLAGEQRGRVLFVSRPRD